MTSESTARRRNVSGTTAERPAPNDVDELAALYPLGRPPKEHRRGYIDDTLDAYPPYHLLRGTATAEAIAAARVKAAERGLVQGLAKTSRSKVAAEAARER